MHRVIGYIPTQLGMHVAPSRTQILKQTSSNPQTTTWRDTWMIHWKAMIHIVWTIQATIPLIVREKPMTCHRWIRPSYGINHRRTKVNRCSQEVRLFRIFRVRTRASSRYTLPNSRAKAAYPPSIKLHRPLQHQRPEESSLVKAINNFSI